MSTDLHKGLVNNLWKERQARRSDAQSFSFFDVGSLLMDATLEMRGFLYSAYMAILHHREPIPADDRTAIMRLGAIDIRSYRRLRDEALRMRKIYRREDGSISAAPIERHFVEMQWQRDRKKFAAEERRRRYDSGEVRRREQLTEATRTSVWRKTSGKCVYCGIALAVAKGEPNSFCIDHVLPVTKGGTEDIGNLVPSCFSCNMKKSSKTVLRFLDQRGDVL